MDILLFFYGFILIGILIFPFIVLSKKQVSGEANISRERLELETHRKMLLENLKDLKAEMDSGKISIAEFNDLSGDIVDSLKKIDIELEKSNLIGLNNSGISRICSNCQFISTNTEAQFCARCGKKL